MLLILLSPLLALLADFFRQKFLISKLWVITIIPFATLPSLVVWLAGYSYSAKFGNYLGITIFISGILFAAYSYEDSEPKSKIKPSTNIRFCASGLKEVQSAEVQIPASAPGFPNIYLATE